MICLTLGSIYVILAISENSSSDEKLELLGLYGRAIAQDWLVTPLIFMLLMFVLSDKYITKMLSHKV